MEWHDTKSSILVKLQKNKDLNIPNLKVISSNCLKKFISYNKITVPYSEEKIMRGDFFPDLISEIREIFGELTVPLICRSSAKKEDGVSFSFAGQFRSIIGITTLSELLAALKFCWAGFFSKRVNKYAKTNKLSLSTIEQIEVFIQNMVVSNKSGVMFYSRKYNSLKIEANWGLGESVASGITDVDNYTVNIKNKTVKRKLSKNKTIILYYEKASELILGQHVSIKLGENILGDYKVVSRGTLDHTLQLEQINNNFLYETLNKKNLDNLIYVSKILGNIYKIDLDIEWTIDSTGKVYVVQVRPISMKQNYNNEIFNYYDESDNILSIGKSTGFLCNKNSKFIKNKKAPIVKLN